MNDIVAFGQQGTAPAAPGAGQFKLSRRAKAAIVVRLLLNEGADIPLEELPDDLQARLTQQMGTMRVVSRDVLHAVVDEFATELNNIGLSFPGGLIGALSALDGKISSETAERLRKEAGVRDQGDPWDRLRAVEAEALLPMVENESTEVIAVVLSKLEVSKAAKMLGLLPGPRARQITYAVSLTNSVTPEAVARIGLSLASQLDDVPRRAFDTEPVERVGAILNSSTALTRDDMLGGLDETDQEFANAVRKAIFTFEHIPARVNPRDVPRILRDADPADVVTALAGVQDAGLGAVMTFILGNMSSRMADQLREDLADRGQVKPAQAEEAMSTLVAIIRQLEAAGEITLVDPDDAE